MSKRASFARGLIQAYLRIAQTRLAACAIVALFPLVIRVALLPWYPIPAPAVHDEFSYLLGADTFASGRLANAPHPLWQHFETFHVNQQPVYASKYPPMQALVLAAGQKLGDPWIGVLLSVALMCGCICWAMQGWLAPGVAFGGALLAALRLGISSYWSNSYWGGAVAAIGGALVIGALPRLMRKPGRSTSVLFALGLVILANSRPYEGLFLAAPATVVLIVINVRNGGAGPLLRIALKPVLAILVPAALAMGYYNYRITGDWLLLPYQLHDQQYVVAPVLIFFQHPHKIPVYHHAVMKEFWAGWDAEYTPKARAHWIKGFVDHIELGMLFFFGPLLLGVVMILLPHPWGNTTDRVTFPILMVFLAGLLLEREVLPHYWAPVVALLFVRFMNTVASLWSWKPFGWPVGALTGMVAIQCSVVLSFLFLGPMLSAPAHNRFAEQRKKVEARLAAMAGRHLVVVRYSATHSAHQEWVYNRADIDSSRIVWARDMGDENNRHLRRHFANRSIWLLEPDKASLPLTPY